MMEMFDAEVIASGGNEVLRVPHMTIIHRRGDEGDCAYFVKSGHVELRQKGRAVETVGPGEIFGEACMLTRTPRLAAAVAIGNVELLRIDRAMFNVLLRDDEDFAMAILMRLARRLRATTEVFEQYVTDTIMSAERAVRASA